MSSLKSRVQNMALLAFKFAEEVKGKDYKDKYLSYVKKLPSMITHNGLMATVVFAKKKASKDNQEGRAWKHVLNHLERFLKDSGKKKDDKDMVDYLGELSLQEYRVITRLVLDFAVWLKNVAEGEIKDESKGI